MKRPLVPVLILLLAGALAPDGWSAVGPGKAKSAPHPPKKPQGTEKTETPEDVPAKVFVTKCAGCHTLGKGKLTGPDLMEAVRWKEADLEAAVAKMQKNVGPLGPEDLQSLVSFLKDPQVSARIERAKERAAQLAATKLAPPSPRAGEGLFTGAAAFRNGGQACVACHQADGRGGTMGPSLEKAFSKMGEVPLRSAVEKTSFKVMSAAYRAHPVTSQEAADVTAYLKTVSEKTPLPDPLEGAVPLVGAGISLLSLGGIAAFYRRRRPEEPK